MSSCKGWGGFKHAGCSESFECWKFFTEGGRLKNNHHIDCTCLILDIVHCCPSLSLPSGRLHQHLKVENRWHKCMVFWSYYWVCEWKNRVPLSSSYILTLTPAAGAPLQVSLPWAADDWSLPTDIPRRASENTTKHETTIRQRIWTTWKMRLIRSFMGTGKTTSPDRWNKLNGNYGTFSVTVWPTNASKKLLIYTRIAQFSFCTLYFFRHHFSWNCYWNRRLSIQHVFLDCVFYFQWWTLFAYSNSEVLRKHCTSTKSDI